MIRRSILLFVFAVLFLPLVAQKMAKVKLYDGRIKMKIPADWIEMSVEDIIMRYPSIRNPVASYTSLDRLSDFNAKVSATRWIDEDKELALQFFKASIYDLFDKVTVIGEGIKEINGREFIYFEFESYLRGGQASSAERKYSYILYYLEKGNTMVFSFRCPTRQKKEWYDTAHEMMESIRIKNIQR